jgi:hypothetical protein
VKKPPKYEQHTGSTPRCNDLDIGLETVKCQLESDLVVTLSGAAMGDVAINNGIRRSFYIYGIFL